MGSGGSSVAHSSPVDLNKELDGWIKKLPAWEQKVATGLRSGKSPVEIAADALQEFYVHHKLA